MPLHPTTSEAHHSDAATSPQPPEPITWPPLPLTTSKVHRFDAVTFHQPPEPTAWTPLPSTKFQSALFRCCYLPRPPEPIIQLLPPPIDLQSSRLVFATSNQPLVHQRLDAAISHCPLVPLTAADLLDLWLIRCYPSENLQ